MNGQLIQVFTKDGIKLTGFFIKGHKNKPVVLHIHGCQGDFFSNKFVYVIGDKLEKNNISFLTVQTRGMANDYTLDTTKYGQGKRIGAYHELLEEAYLDIDSWVKFLKDQGFKKITLQGHSLGTIKIIRYLFEGEYKSSISKLILLAPFDKTFLIKQFTKNKYKSYIKIAKQKVKAGKGTDIIPKNWEDIKLSYQSYISWYQEDDLSHMFDFFDKNYHFPILNKINIPVKCIVGSKDEYFHLSNYKHPEEAINVMKKNIKSFSSCLIKNSNHGYIGFEKVIANEILKFI